MDNQFELLAPAGNKEAFIGAINAGADAVYLGGTKYSARAYADNFSTEDIIFCIRYAHIHGKKVYLTVNTLMKEEEIQELPEYIAPFYKAGLDACIVQDIGAFQCLKKHFPHMELHASTQMTITGTYSAQMLKDMGATRIVPARELSLREIQAIKKDTGLELETFIHGAMCYCYSGQCLFSSLLGGRSGNRGRCAQPCRLPYQVNSTGKTTGECYPLSLKDMCTIEHLDALMDAGIDSFKIEGRMKKPEYSAGVTSIYRKYIDKKLKSPDKPLQISKKDLEILSKLYIRSEVQDGYYFKQNGPDMVTLTSSSYSGSDDALLLEIRNRYLEATKKLPISIYASFITGERVSVSMIYGDISVSVEGDVAEEAQNAPISEENIRKQLNKLGDTSFTGETIEIYTDNHCFYSLKALNELRRRAVKELEDAIILSNGLVTEREVPVFSANAQNTSNKNAPSPSCALEKDRTNNWTIGISTKEQLDALLQFGDMYSITFDRIYLESGLFQKEAAMFKLLPTENLYIALPYCMRKKDYPAITALLERADKANIKGFLVRNLEEYAFLKSINYTGEIRTDAGIYIWNSYSLDFWNEHAAGLHCPIELNTKEWKPLFNQSSFEKMVYGYIPMMITANCVAKTTDTCQKNSNAAQVQLIDRYHKEFPVILSCDYCYNIILNTVPLSLHNDLLKQKQYYDKKLQFTKESGRETLEIIKFFRKIDEEQLTETPFKEYTTGHERRGVQ